MIFKKFFFLISFLLINVPCFAVDEEMSLEGALLLKEHRLLSGPSKVKIEVDLPLYHVTYQKGSQQGQFYILPSNHAYPFAWLPEKVKEIALNADFLVHEIDQDQVLNGAERDYSIFYTSQAEWFDWLSPKVQDFLRTSKEIEELHTSLFRDEKGPCFSSNESFCRAVHPYLISDAFGSILHENNPGLSLLLRFHSMDVMLMRNFFQKPWFGLETVKIADELAMQTLRHPQEIKNHVSSISEDIFKKVHAQDFLTESLEEDKEENENPFYNARNKYWIDHTLAQIVSFPSDAGLLMYGCGHNSGPYSILGHFQSLQAQGELWNGAVITSIKEVDVSKEEAEGEDF